MPAQQDAFSNVGMLPDAHLSPQNDIVFHHNASRETCLGCNHHILTDPAVVPDVYQIVDLGAAPDMRDLKRPSVNGGVGPDLDVILDL